jgi:hypothetical protein
MSIEKEIEDKLMLRKEFLQILNIGQAGLNRKHRMQEAGSEKEKNLPKLIKIGKDFYYNKFEVRQYLRLDK